MRNVRLGVLAAAALAAMGALGGVALAYFHGGPLGFLSFHINGTGGNVTWIPVYIDLGTLNENQTVNATGEATIELPEGGVYIVNIVGPARYARVFSYFHVKVVFDGNKTVVLTLRHPAARVRLPEGVHHVEVTLEAKVRSHLPSITVEHTPFLAIHEAPSQGGHGAGYSGYHNSHQGSECYCCYCGGHHRGPGPHGPRGWGGW